MPTPVSPVVYAIYVNGQKSVNTPLDVQLIQEWGQHDVFILRIVAPKSRPQKWTLTTWPDNSPIQVVWGRGADNMHTWYGYVNHHTTSSEDDAQTGSIQVTYVCLGTSKPMNTQKSRTWNSIRPEGIASTIAREYNLRAIVTSSANVLDNETQAAESDFQFLNRIAQKWGYRFWVSGGTLYFIQPAVLLSGLSASYIPHYRIDKQVGKLDTAANFQLLEGGNLPGSEVAQRTVYGFDQNGNVVSASAGSTANGINLVNTSRVVRSYGEATQIITATQALDQFWLQGTVQVFGYTGLYPGKVIYLYGNAMPDSTTGFWIVTGATHTLAPSFSTVATKDKYVTNLTIIQNTRALTPNITGVHQISPEFVQCNLLAGQWRANQAGVFSDGMVNLG